MNTACPLPQDPQFGILGFGEVVLSERLQEPCARRHVGGGATLPSAPRFVLGEPVEGHALVHVLRQMGP